MNFIISSSLSILLTSLLSFCLLSSSNSAAAAATISIPLSLSTTAAPPYQRLSHLASLSLSRAHNIKRPKSATSSSAAAAGSISTTPRSYGAYSISLKFGTPPQAIPFLLDTGSSFTWFPCTQRYVCKNCSANGGASSPSSSAIASFIPKASSSVQILGCMNPKCTWIHNKSDSSTRCKDCRPAEEKNCKQICPPYLLFYGTGSTSGITLVETLRLPTKNVPNFIVGCSLFSSHQPAGLAAFGRGPTSMPSQLGLNKFSYCLASHKFDDESNSGELVLDNDSYPDKKSPNLTYTPLIKNPITPDRTAFYYVGLKRITIGRRKIKIPNEYLTPDENGNGGTIVDSGTTFTFLNYNIFKPMSNAILDQVKGYKRESEIESSTNLQPCFNISGQDKFALPQMKFYFRGGGKMELPLANYFVVVNAEVVCLSMVSNDFYGAYISSGPSIILGNFQMQNYHVEYDLKNERLGFRQQICR